MSELRNKLLFVLPNFKNVHNSSPSAHSNIEDVFDYAGTHYQSKMPRGSAIHPSICFSELIRNTEKSGSKWSLWTLMESGPCDWKGSWMADSWAACQHQGCLRSVPFGMKGGGWVASMPATPNCYLCYWLNCTALWNPWLLKPIIKNSRG